MKEGLSVENEALVKAVCPSWIGSDERFMRGLNRLLDAARLSTTPPLPAGELVLVPREPTEEMQMAGRHAIPGGHGQAWLYAADCYRAMIAAAPTPPLPVEGIGA